MWWWSCVPQLPCWICCPASSTLYDGFETISSPAKREEREARVSVERLRKWNKVIIHFRVIDRTSLFLFLVILPWGSGSYTLTWLSSWLTIHEATFINFVLQYNSIHEGIWRLCRLRYTIRGIVKRAENYTVHANNQGIKIILVP